MFPPSGVRRFDERFAVAVVGVSVPEGWRLSLGESGVGPREERRRDSAISWAMPLPRLAGGRWIGSGGVVVDVSLLPPSCTDRAYSSASVSLRAGRRMEDIVVPI